MKAEELWIFLNQSIAILRFKITFFKVCPSVCLKNSARPPLLVVKHFGFV